MRLIVQQVHPRGPAVPTNVPDNNPTTTGQNPLSTTGDQPPRLDDDTSHYYDANAICVANYSYDANAICVANYHSKSDDNEDHNTEPPLKSWRTILDDVLEVYQYYVHKPPPEAQSRRRERYQLRIAQQALTPGARKKRCRRGSPDTSNFNKTVNNNNSTESKGTARICVAAFAHM